MLEINQKKQMYLVTLTNGNRLLVTVKDEAKYDAPLSQKKNMIIQDLNETFGLPIVVSVKFYGYAKVTKSNNYVQKRTRIKFGI